MPSFGLGTPPVVVPVGGISYYGTWRTDLKFRVKDWGEVAPGFSVMATGPAFVFDPVGDVVEDDVALMLAETSDGPMGYVLDNRSISDTGPKTFDLYANDVVLTSYDDGSMSPVVVTGVVCVHAIDGLLVWRARFEDDVSLMPGDSILLDWRPNTG